MRKDLVEAAVKYSIEHSPKIDAVGPLPFDLTPEERELISKRLKEESDKLPEWPEPVIM
ncbi:hypothetical protein [Enterococcus sp. AZ163]|uniref:hypothetical protein n=1 Tax=Enterococcus sp. AZ163 TaxID=2774638 RepID=UPI003D2CC5B2